MYVQNSIKGPAALAAMAGRRAGENGAFLYIRSAPANAIWESGWPEPGRFSAIRFDPSAGNPTRSTTAGPSWAANLCRIYSSECPARVAAHGWAQASTIEG